MSLLDTASLIVTPNAVKEGKLYSVIPSDGSGDMSVVRATTATRVNSAGLVELVPYNLFTYSEQFDNADWTKLDTTILANSIASPSGVQNADKIQENTNNAFHLIEQVYATTNGTNYALSFYVKKAERNFAVLGVFTNESKQIRVNLTTGTITSTNGTWISTSIESVENGWYRVTGVFTASTALAYVFCGPDLNGSANAYTGTAGSGIYAWGAQLVEGSTAKDYQKTETRLNIPRLDYSNGTCPSLLVEPQRTNLLTYSSSFDNAAWVKLNGSVTANIAISPSGIQDADSFIPNTTSGFHALRSNNFNQSSTASHSWFLKANGYSKIAVRESDLPIGNYASFDLSTGTLISTSQSGIIEDYGNGWYRCTLVDTNTGAGAQTSIFVLPDNYTTGDPLIAWSGDGIKGVFAYGAQAELGSYPTSYIPTTSASVTRNADVISKTGISSLIGQTEGVVFFDLELNNTPIDDSYIFIRNSNASNYIGLRIQNNLIRYEGAVSASSTCSIPKSAVANTRYKVALAYNTNDFAMYVNGDLIGTDNVGTIGSMDTLDLNFNLPGVNSYEFNAAALWQTRLDNATLASLTTL
jgi:hypothetical protein